MNGVRPRGVARLAVERELHDVVGGHQRRRQRAGHQEAVGIAGVAHRHMAGRIEHALVGQDATGRREILEHVAFDAAARSR